LQPARGELPALGEHLSMKRTTSVETGQCLHDQWNVSFLGGVLCFASIMANATNWSIPQDSLSERADHVGLRQTLALTERRNVHRQTVSVLVNMRAAQISAD